MSVIDAGGVTQTVSAGLCRNRNFQWLFVSGTICFIGNQFSLVGIPWLALRLTGNPAVLAMTVASTSIPQVLILLGGATADRYSPRSILIVTNCANAVVVAALAITTASGLLQTHLLLALTGPLRHFSCLCNPRWEFAATKDRPAGFACPRQLSFHDVSAYCHADRTHRRRRMPSARFAEAMGVSSALAINTATFMIAAWSIRFVRVPLPMQATSSSLLRSMAEGLRWLWNDRWLRTLLIYYAAMMLLVTSVRGELLRPVRIVK